MKRHTPSKRIGLALAACLAWGLSAAAQTQPGSPNATPDRPRGQDQASRSSPEPETAGDQPAPVPVLIDGTITSLALSSELERTNYLTAGASVGATYDDNIFSTPSGTGGGFSYFLMPFIAIDESHARLHWNLSYAAGFVANQHIEPQTQYAHNLGAELDYRLSPHVNLRLQDHFSITTNFYDQLLLTPTSTPTGTLQQPNTSLITPLAKQISNLASAEMTYQFSPGDMVGGSGSFYNLSFHDVPAVALDLLNTQSAQGNGFYSHRLAPRNWLGLAYGYQQLSFDPAVQRSYTQSFLLFDTMYLNPKATLSVFAGPEISEVDSLVVPASAGVPPIFVITTPTTQRKTLAAGGVIFTWQGENTSFQASASRRVSDGGGILGAVELNSVILAARRKLARFTTFSVAGIYGDNTALGTLAAGGAQLQAASGSFSLDQQLRRDLMLTLGYARDYQRESGVVSPPADVNHNRGWISLTYRFTRPIGR